MTFGNASEQLRHLLQRLSVEPAVLVQVQATEGSAPREAGSWMAVFADALIGTVGGGHLEYEVIKTARSLLATPGPVSAHEQQIRFALGPSLGQCCGGAMNLSLRGVTASDIEELREKLQQQLVKTFQPVALFGGGHVGHALVRVLAYLPFALTWIDSRDGVFPADVPANVQLEHSDPVQAAVRALASQSRVLIMSFSHAEDLDVVAACLQRQRERADLPYIGLIGSKTKWAVFRHRLEARGFGAAEFGHVTSPIGVPGIAGKEPEVIAVAVAAQLLQTLPQPD